MKGVEVTSSRVQEQSARPFEHAYRRDIDGLRAVAVLSVLGFHAFPKYVPGGFVGVDIFFVISGFLISGIIFSSIDRGSFSLVEFYERRILRIFPALVTVLLACLLVGALTLFPLEYMGLGKHIAGSAGFIENFLLWNESGYFDQAAETKPLLHIWSLGIEEQFYIVAPFLLYAIHRSKYRGLSVLLVLLLASFALNVVVATYNRTADFYSPLTRAWELLAGIALAYMTRYRPAITWGIPKKIAIWGRSGLALGGAALVAAAIVFLNDGVAFPGWAAILPVAGAYLIIFAGPFAWLNGSLLSSRVMVGIGLISYPLYLWHWPLLSFTRIIQGKAPSPLAATMAILISGGLAVLTYKLIERPLRFGKRAGRTLPNIAMPKIAMLAVGMMTVGVGGYFIYANGGLPSRTPEIQQALAAATDFDFGGPASINGVDFHFGTYRGIIETFTVGKSDTNQTVLLGDSTAQQYIPRLRELAEQGKLDLDHNFFAVVVETGCSPIPNIASYTNPRCAAFADHLNGLLNTPKIKTVAFASLWTADLMVAENYLRDISPPTLLRDSAAARNVAFQNFGRLVTQLVNDDKKVFVVLETPTSHLYDVDQILPHGWDRLFKKLTIRSPKRAEVEAFNGQINARLEQIARSAGAHVIKPMDYLCNSDVCPSDDAGQLRYFDHNHLRASYVRQHATYIDRIFGANTVLKEKTTLPSVKVAAPGTAPDANRPQP